MGVKKYQTLINVLDKIRNEAPLTYKSYYPKKSNPEAINQARSRTFIHLYLKVKFGILDFEEREHYITDGSQDGGVDGYFIDKESKTIFYIQSKFRTTQRNFEEKEIKLSEILSMDIANISEGKEKDEDGNPYNGKIKQLIREIRQIEGIAKYSHQVVILANLGEIKPSKLRLLTGGFATKIFDFERCYEELIFPVVSGAFYNLSELHISINLTNKGASSKVSYKVNTEYKDCNIAVLFVPTVEIAKILYKYKNSILKYNPRSYLDLADSRVNQAIRDTILKKTTNEFALFNNGITILSDDTHYNENVGVPDKARLTITNGQIINGGQTAYTLSTIYENALKTEDNPEKIFHDKEVLLKVITVDDRENTSAEKKLELIEAISKATNQQTEVTEADRRSNDKIQIEIQHNIFKTFGYYYERKRGEFGDGIRNKYIDRNMIIDRDHLLRICLACDGKASQARRNSEKVNFIVQNFNETLKDATRYKEYFYGIMSFVALDEIQQTFDRKSNNLYGEAGYGNSFRYGKYAVVSVAIKDYKNDFEIEDFFVKPKKSVNRIIDKWLDFEKFIEGRKHNSAYFRRITDADSGVVRLDLNYSGYYKGKTLNDDLREFFKLKK